MNNNFFFQFWAAYVPCEAQYKDAVQLTLEQIDVIIRLTNKYSNDLTICTSAKGMRNFVLPTNIPCTQLHWILKIKFRIFNCRYPESAQRQ